MQNPIEKLEILLNYNIPRTIDEKEAFIMGFFFADGSCGKYKYYWINHRFIIILV